MAAPLRRGPVPDWQRGQVVRASVQRRGDRSSGLQRNDARARGGSMGAAHDGGRDPVAGPSREPGQSLVVRARATRAGSAAPAGAGPPRRSREPAPAGVPGQLDRRQEQPARDQYLATAAVLINDEL